VIVNWVMDVGVDLSGEICVLIDASNIGSKGRNISPGLVMIFVHGSEALLPILVAGVGHWDGVVG
jgi:hypothetical protein